MAGRRLLRIPLAENRVGRTKVWQPQSSARQTRKSATIATQGAFRDTFLYEYHSEDSWRYLIVDCPALALCLYYADTSGAVAGICVLVGGGDGIADEVSGALEYSNCSEAEINGPTVPFLWSQTHRTSRAFDEGNKDG